jgi:hypothetical protein
MTESLTPSIEDLLKQELHRPLEPAVLELADAARRRVDGVAAVIFYGSCLRDGLSPDAVADLYILVETYAVSGQPWLAHHANRALPPNVIYLEAETSNGVVRAKAAIVALEHFRRLCGPQTFHSYFWARFTQPSALAWSSGPSASDQVAGTIFNAIRTFATEAGAQSFPSTDSRAFWVNGFQHTYASELRAEGPERAVKLYLSDQVRYDQIFQTLQGNNVTDRSTPARWRRRRIWGKALSVARLAKAVFTFDGGLDYILWKIARHSGVHIKPSPWQQRHPLLAAPCLAIKVWRMDGFR